MVDTITVWSEALNSTTLLKIILPDQADSKKIMILLHGNMNPELSTELLERFPKELALEELCNRFGVAVVIPLMKNRYYISTKDYDCNRFVAVELPELVRKKYGISDSVEMCFIGILLQ